MSIASSLKKRNSKSKFSEIYNQIANISFLFSILRFLIVGLITLVLISCNNKTFETAEALWSYIKDTDNGYLQNKTVNGVEFSLLYKPTDLLVEQELVDYSEDSLIKRYRNKYKDFMYFTLSMAKNNRELLSNVAGNKQQFGAMVGELAFGMGQKVHLYTSQKDTITLTDYIYPRMYGMSGATTMLFVYPRNKKELEKEYLNFTIEDLGFYTGEVKFKVPTAIINEEPGIDFTLREAILE